MNNDSDDATRPTNKMRNRDILKQALASTFGGHSSRTTEQQSFLIDAIVPSVGNSLSIVPAVSQAQKEQLFPPSPPAQETGSHEGATPRGPPNGANAGSKTPAMHLRLPSASGQSDKKPASDKKSGSKLDGHKTGGKSGKN